MSPPLSPADFDLASFRPRDVEAVFGPMLQDVFTLRRDRVERSHILGRGESMGVRKNDSRRLLYSSVFNCCPLWHDIHVGPYRDHPLIRRFFLEVVKQKVFEAVRDRRYEMGAVDTAFLTEVAYPWLEKNRHWMEPEEVPIIKAAISAPRPA